METNGFESHSKNGYPQKKAKDTQAGDIPGWLYIVTIVFLTLFFVYYLYMKFS